MARSRLCRVCRDFHDLATAWPSDCLSHFGAVSDEAAFYIVSDSMAPIRSMADGQMYDSKSAYRRDLKSRGLVEVGNDRQEQRRAALPPVRDAMRQAIHQLSS